MIEEEGVSKHIERQKAGRWKRCEAWNVECPVLWAEEGPCVQGPTKDSRVGLQCSRWWGSGWAGSRKIGWRCVLEQQPPSLSPHSQVAPSSTPAEGLFPHRHRWLGQLRPSLGWKEAVWRAAAGGGGRQEETLYWEQEDLVKVSRLNSEILSWWAPRTWQPGFYSFPARALKDFSEETDLRRQNGPQIMIL